MSALLPPFFLLILGFAAGRYLEHCHFRSLCEREEKLLTTPTVTTRTWPDGRGVARAELAVGSVVRLG